VSQGLPLINPDGTHLHEENYRGLMRMKRGLKKENPKTQV